MIKLGYWYNELDKQYEFFLDCGNPSCYTQWIFYGIGQILQDEKVNLYPYYPSWRYITTLKEYKATSGHNYTWYGNRIGKIISKKLESIKKSKKK